MQLAEKRVTAESRRVRGALVILAYIPTLQQRSSISDSHTLSTAPCKAIDTAADIVIARASRLRIAVCTGSIYDHNILLSNRLEDIVYVTQFATFYETKQVKDDVVRHDGSRVQFARAS